MNPFTNRISTLAPRDADGLTAVRQIAGVAFDGFDKVARRNDAFAGDVVAPAVAQAKRPLNMPEPKALIERQAEAGKAFVGLISGQWNGYVELRKDLQQRFATLADVTVVQPATTTNGQARRRKAA